MMSIALTAAQSAGKLLREHFGKEVHIHQESDHDIKIQTDLEAQALIFSIILEAYPDHKLLGEEGDAGNPEGEVEWIVDPLDGTVNYAMGIPHFCTSIAARSKKGLLLGVIYDPLRDELFTAEKGKGAYWNGNRVEVSSRQLLSQAIIAIGIAKTEDSVEHFFNLYAYYARRARKLRAMGSAALDLAYVASGRLDAYLEQGLSLWDIAAGQLLVEEAGGIFSSDAQDNGSYKIMASNGKIHFPQL